MRGKGGRQWGSKAYSKNSDLGTDLGLPNSGLP